MYDEGVHGASDEQGMKIGKKRQARGCPNTPETQYSVDSNE